MVRYRFQLMAMGTKGVKHIECDPSLGSDALRDIVRREYHLNRVLSIQFLYKGAVLPDDFTLATLGIRPDTDVIAVYTHDYCSAKLPHVPKP